MSNDELRNIWSYFLVLEEDIANTARFSEPTQGKVFSFEYLKIIILACCELESVFKLVCESITGVLEDRVTIQHFRKTILAKYPHLDEASVSISRAKLSFRPYKDWHSKELPWWKAYQNIKHNRVAFFVEATYDNAISSLSALYIMILYLARIKNVDLDTSGARYIQSEYTRQCFYTRNERELPDFDKNM